MSMLQGDMNLWDQLWSNLKDKFGKNFQMQLPYTSYYWEDPRPGYINYRTYDLFNERPSWNALGKREVAGTGVYEGYGAVIQFAPKFVATPGQQQELADLESQINGAQAQKTKDSNASYTAFFAAKEKAKSVGIDLEYSPWMADNGWAKILQGDELLVGKLQNQKAAILNQYPDNKKVMEAYTPPEPTAPTTSKAFLKCFISTSEYWRAIYEAPTPHDIVNMMSKGGQQLGFTLDSSKSSSAVKNSWAGRNASFNDFFFGIYAGGAWKKFDLTESSQSVSLNVAFEKIDSFTVRSGDWYSGAYLANLKQQNSWASGYTEDKVFGKDGLLPLITTNFIATIGMTLTVKISQSSFEKHQKEFKAAGGIQIGPFKFGGDGGTSSEKWKREAADSAFTINLTDQYPYIIGYMVARADGARL